MFPKELQPLFGSTLQFLEEEAPQKLSDIAAESIRENSPLKTRQRGVPLENRDD